MKFFCQVGIALAFTMCGVLFALMHSTYETVGQDLAICQGGIAVGAWCFGMSLLINVEHID